MVLFSHCGPQMAFEKAANKLKLKLIAMHTDFCQPNKYCVHIFVSNFCVNGLVYLK